MLRPYTIGIGRAKSMMSVNVFMTAAAVDSAEWSRQVPSASESHALDIGKQENIIQQNMMNEYIEMTPIIVHIDLRYHLKGERRR